MNFILVNGRTPCRTSNCALCGEPIRNCYLRETSTHLYYCDQGCYVAHCKSVIDLAPLKRAALAAFAPKRTKATSEAEVVLTT
jgi:hypothetical protein